MSLIRWRGLEIETRPDVYDPSDDTWLLAESLHVAPGERLLEIGTGTGAVAIHAARLGAHVVATDANPDALRLAQENARRNRVDLGFLRADLLRGIRLDRFDAVAFNPPYLPTGPAERVPGPLNLAFDGGLDGRSVLRRLFDQLPKGRLPRLHVVVSSLQGVEEVRNLIAEVGLAAEIAGERRFPYEALTIFSLTATRPRGDVK